MLIHTTKGIFFYQAASIHAAEDTKKLNIYFFKNLREKENLEGQWLDGRIILSWNFMTW
jgi:hypothetical protein